MGTEAVLQFMKQTAENEQLRDQLGVILGVGDGDISSAKELDAEEAQVLKSIRGSTVTGFAAQQGFSFTAEELSQVVEAYQRLQAGEISQAEFAVALGLPESAPEPKTSVPAIQNTVELVYRGIRYQPVTPPSPDQAAARRTVIQFMEGTAGNETLQQELQAVIGVGDGDISGLSELDDQEIVALKGQRGAQVAEFAARTGYPFTPEDLATVVDAFQRLRAGDLSEAAFSKTVGLVEATTQPLAAIGQMIDTAYRGIPYANAVRSRSPNRAAVLQFMERTAKDQYLRDQLKALLGVGDGDISGVGALDPQEIAALQGEKGKLVTDFAYQRGYLFSVEDLTQVANAYQRLSAGEITEEGFSREVGLADTDKGKLIKKAVTFFYRGILVS